MRERILCIFVLFVLFGNLIVLGEEVDQPSPVVQAYEKMPDNPSQEEIQSLYELMLRTATDSFSKGQPEVKKWTFSEYPEHIGLKSLSGANWAAIANSYVFDSPMKLEKVHRPTIKNCVLRVLLLKVLCELPQGTISPFKRAFIYSSIKQNYESYLFGLNSNPFVSECAEYFSKEISSISAKYKLDDALLIYLQKEASRKQFEGEGIQQKIMGWRKWVDSGKLDLKNKLIAYFWIRENVADSDLFASEIPQIIDITAQKREMEFMLEYVNAWVYRNDTSKLSGDEIDRCNIPFSDEMLLNLIGAKVWKSVIAGKNAKGLRSRLLALLFSQMNDKRLANALRMIEPLRNGYLKQMSEWRDNFKRGVGNYELISLEKGEAGPAWFVGEFELDREGGHAKIAKDFMFPHVRMVYTQDPQSKNSVQSIVYSKQCAVQEILTDTGLFMWERFRYLKKEYLSTTKYEVDAEMEYDYSPEFISNFLTKDLDKYIPEGSPIVKGSITPRTVFGTFSPCVLYHCPRTQYEIFSIGSTSEEIQDLFEVSVALVVITPLEGEAPDKCRQYLYPTANNWVSKTGISPLGTPDWLHKEVFASEVAGEISSRASDHVKELVGSFFSRRDEWTKKLASARKESFGGLDSKEAMSPKMQKAVDKLLEQNRARTVNGSEDEVQKLFSSIGDEPSEESYQKILGFFSLELSDWKCRAQDFGSLFSSQDPQNTFIQWIYGKSSFPKSIRRINQFSCWFIPTIEYRGVPVWQKYALNAALIEAILTRRAELGKPGDEEFDTLTIIAALYASSTKIFSIDNLLPEHKANYTWLENKLAILEDEYHFITDYRAKVKSCEDSLSIEGGSLTEKIISWREKLNKAVNPQEVSALLLWAENNIKAENLLNDSLPEVVSFEDLKNASQFVDKFGRLGEYGVGKLKLRSIDSGILRVSFADYFLVALTLWKANKNIEGSEDVPFLRKCFASSMAQYDDINFIRFLSHLHKDMAPDLVNFLLSKESALLECRLFEHRFKECKFEKINEFEGGEFWFAGEDAPIELKGEWKKERVTLLPVTTVAVDGATVLEEPSNRFAGLDQQAVLRIIGKTGGLTSSINPLTGMMRINSANKVSGKGLQGEYDFSLAAIRGSLDADCLAIEFPGLPKSIVEKILAKSEGDEEVKGVANFTPCVYYSMPRAKWTVWRITRYTDYSLANTIGTGEIVICVSPYEGDAPTEMRMGMRYGRYESVLWKLGLLPCKEVTGAIPTPKPLNFTEIPDSAEFKAIFDAFGKLLEEDAKDNRAFETALHGNDGLRQRHMLEMWGNIDGKCCWE